MTETISDRIVERIAESEHTRPAKLDTTLYEHIPTDALRTLMRHDAKSWRLQFETESHIIEVAGNGTILVDGELS